MEVLNLYKAILGWVFPYISRIHTAYIGEYLHTWNVWWYIHIYNSPKPILQFQQVCSTHYAFSRIFSILFHNHPCKKQPLLNKQIPPLAHMSLPVSVTWKPKGCPFCWKMLERICSGKLTHCWWKKSCTSWYVVYPSYLQGFIHPRWLFGISSINSSNGISPFSIGNTSSIRVHLPGS